MLKYLRQLFSLRRKVMKKQHLQDTMKDSKMSEAEFVAALMFPTATLKQDTFGKRKVSIKQRGQRKSSGQSNIKRTHKTNTCKNWTISFETMIFDKAGRRHFRSFLSSEFSEENIDFWVACEQFKKASKNRIVSTSREIFNKFIDDKSPKQINIDSKIRNALVECLSQPTPHMFNNAQRRVQHMLENDAYRRFLDSEAYKKLCAMS